MTQGEEQAYHHGYQIGMNEGREDGYLEGGNEVYEKYKSQLEWLNPEDLDLKNNRLYLVKDDDKVMLLTYFDSGGYHNRVDEPHFEGSDIEGIDVYISLNANILIKRVVI